jgi:hypothetical protein
MAIELTHPRVPAARPAPAGGRLAAVARAIWRALEEEGRRRGSREMLSLAQRWQHSEPDLAATCLRAARELARPEPVRR